MGGDHQSALASLRLEGVTLLSPRKEHPVRVRLLFAIPVLLVGLPVWSAWASPEVPRGAFVPTYAGPTTRIDWEQVGREGDLVAWYAWAAAQPAPQVVKLSQRHNSGGHRGYGSAKECVAMVEHGGSYDRSSNPSHFGKYQFSRGTWVAFGGNPETWGSASPEEQDAVFETAWNSPGGPNHWLPYDGC